MYTVIIADDEEEIRSGIVKKVEWDKVGFRVIGEASNGAEALEAVEKLEPDLLITDIKMPFLSGLELARVIREVRPTVQIVFLSGFDEFSYAQEAISYNIISYLLKPITAKELEGELVKIREAMDKKFSEFARGTRDWWDIGRTEFLLPLLMDSFLPDGESEAGLRQQAFDCGLLRDAKAQDQEFVVIATAIRDEHGMDQTQRSSVHAIDMILKKYVSYASCYLKGRVVSLIAATHDELEKYLHIIVEEIIQSVERIMGLYAQVGVSRPMDQLGQCREGYIEAMNALSYSHSGSSSVYYIADTENADALNQEEIHKISGKIETLLRGGTEQELSDYLDGLEQKSRSGGRDSRILSTILMAEILASLYKIIFMAIGNEGLIQLEETISSNHLLESERTAENFQRIRRMCMNTKKLLSDQRQRSGERICQQAVRIVQEKYADSDISVLSISEEIGISPNYLSSLIRKNTGNTLIEILTQQRMDKALDLLENTDLKIAEITGLCGYKDPYYFSYCFKKATGMSPSGYRKEHGKAEGA